MMVCLPCLRPDPSSPAWAQTKHTLVCTFGGPVCPTGSPAVLLLAVSEKKEQGHQNGNDYQPKANLGSEGV